ncbi:YbaK family protein [Bacillus sonorensis]|uniref:YbaK family protein n=1 Tax=Bacillus sonorensis TaxID=119858 RepID=UPI00227E8541|nr:YbaK family protein [Bacillus sonorensis]MCZ0071029.1 YbaK family protein [Bacillus sonorensis]MCZ0098559.1 YbaK family protein [Bacillus sonorensis]MEC1503844.1 YbaK family protein [Bacillus sonorensis]MEC1518049.1 YbaK family protein [Bacillus sonorensis]
MGVVLSFMNEKQKKQMNLEKKLLRELSIEKIMNIAEECFTPLIHFFSKHTDILYDGCIDFAIEAYLLGAQFGKFGYYGESVQKAMTRSEQEEKQLLHELYEYSLSWSEAFNITISHEGLYYACEHFIQTWWKEGFSEREKRIKLRLR